VTLPKELTHRPAVHFLCSGAYVQEHLELGGAVSAYSLLQLGFDAQAAYTLQYARDVIGAPVDSAAFDALKEQGKQSHPVVALVARLENDAGPQELESAAAPLLDRARMILGWVTGGYPELFAVVTARSDRAYFRLIPPPSRRRIRLGFGNTGADYQAQLARLVRSASTDERFAFALSMFQEALRERHPEFRAARMFACLEALAYRVKTDKGSRTRVRALLGLEDGATVRIGSGSDQYEFDRVELAGRIRDKLFHGAPFRPEKDLNGPSANAYRYLASHPEELGNILLSDCELEFARWANGASVGQRIDDGAQA
jgi:hypothetical protein